MSVTDDCGNDLLLLNHALVTRLAQSVKSRNIVLDSGATSHMTPLICIFDFFLNNAQGTVSLGDVKVKLRIMGKGPSRIKCLGDFLFVPQLSFSLISIPVLDKLGYITSIGGGVMRVFHNSTVILSGTLHTTDGLYHLDPVFERLLLGGCGEDNAESVALGVADDGIDLSYNCSQPQPDDRSVCEVPVSSLRGVEFGLLPSATTEEQVQILSTSRDYCQSISAFIQSTRCAGIPSLNPRRRKRIERSDSPVLLKYARFLSPESIVLPCVNYSKVIITR